jgi:hypothetical protein
MAVHTGSEGTVKVGSNAVAELKSYTIEETGDVIETTALGDTSRTYVAGLKTFTGTIDVYWDETDSSGQGALTVGSEITINFYPEGDTAGDTYYTGTAIVTGRSVTGTTDGTVDRSFTIQGTGALSETTV